MQSLSAVILLGFSSSNVSSTRITLAIGSLALVITCLVMITRDQLSLHDAIVASSLLDFTLTPLYFVESWTSRIPGLFVANFLRFPVFMAIKLWLYLKGPCFGNKVQYNMCIGGFFNPTSRILWRGCALFYYGCVFATWFIRMFYFMGLSHVLGAFHALISEKAGTIRSTLRIYMEYVLSPQVLLLHLVG
jgi:hypothetical protein